MNDNVIKFEPPDQREKRLWAEFMDAKRIQLADDCEETRKAMWDAYHELAHFLAAQYRQRRGVA
jgi:hypothetical protein